MSQTFFDKDDKGTIDVQRWFFSLIGLDGVLSIITMVVPLLLNSLFPQLPDEMISLSIIIVLAAYIARFYFGSKSISRNHCGQKMQEWQQVLLFLGISYFIFVDMFMCIGAFDPLGWDNTLVIFVVIALIPYLLVMIFAHYPGRSVVDYEEKNFLDKT